MTAITTRLRQARRLLAPPEQDAVHFHMDGSGRAFVCDLHVCDSVGLTLGEAERTQQAATRPHWPSRPRAAHAAPSHKRR